MEAKYFNEKKKIDMQDIELVSEGIRNGKIAVFPTETVYGIGANALDEMTCEKIFDAKGRPTNKPLIVLVSDLNMLKEIVEDLSEIESKLIEEFWPGPLTIIFEKKKNCKISDVVTGRQNTVGVRMTSGEVARLLIQKARVPIVAPSANLSGNPTGVKMEQIIAELGDKVDYILDCGDIEDSTASTVVQVKDNMIHIFREGKITKEELSKVAQVKMV